MLPVQTSHRLLIRFIGGKARWKRQPKYWSFSKQRSKPSRIFRKSYGPFILTRHRRSFQSRLRSASLNIFAGSRRTLSVKRTKIPEFRCAAGFGQEVRDYSCLDRAKFLYAIDEVF